MTRACLLLAAFLLAAGSSAAHARDAGAQGNANGHAAASTKTHSNKGGAARGLTRADAVAGVHGDKGRDRAAANKTK